MRDNFAWKNAEETKLICTYVDVNKPAPPPSHRCGRDHEPAEQIHEREAAKLKKEKWVQEHFQTDWNPKTTTKNSLK